MTNTHNKLESQQEQLTLLSILIDNDWNPNDFIIVLKCFEFLYGYQRLFVEVNSLLGDEKKMKSSAEEHLSSRKIALILLKESIERIDFDPLNPLHSLDGLAFLGTNRVLNPPLKLRRIQYSSPGSIDFVGLGKIFDAIKELIIYYRPNEEQKLKNKKLQLEIANNEIDVLRKLGYDDLEIKAIVMKKEIATQRISELIHENKIRDIRIEE